jgi:hypothetical protein
MYQIGSPLGAIAVHHVKNWRTEVSTLPGSEAFKLIGRDTPAKQFSESRRIVQ